MSKYLYRASADLLRILDDNEHRDDTLASHHVLEMGRDALYHDCVVCLRRRVWVCQSRVRVSLHEILQTPDGEVIVLGIEQLTKVRGEYVREDGCRPQPILLIGGSIQNLTGQS